MGTAKRLGVVARKVSPAQWGLVVILFCFVVGLTGCAEPYGYAGPGYGAPVYGAPGYAAPGYGGPGYGAPGYGGPYGGPGYAGGGYAGYGGGSIVIDVNDRAYYTRGPGYSVGRTYYVWRPGHWAERNGRRVWIHGHYVRRG